MLSFTRARLPQDARALSEMDARIFVGSEDAFGPDDWNGLEVFWVTVCGERAGTIAFRRDCGGCTHDWEYFDQEGSLYVVSTGILPEYRCMGLGIVLKAFEVWYARKHGFETVVSHARASNTASIAMNLKLGFEITERIKDQYTDPTEDAVKLELRL